MNIKTRARRLDLISRKISQAKAEVFKAQDLAYALADAGLSEQLCNARDAIEAADRRVTDLFIDLPAAACAKCNLPVAQDGSCAYCKTDDVRRLGAQVPDPWSGPCR